LTLRVKYPCDIIVQESFYDDAGCEMLHPIHFDIALSALECDAVNRTRLLGGQGRGVGVECNVGVEAGLLCKLQLHQCISSAIGCVISEALLKSSVSSAAGRYRLWELLHGNSRIERVSERASERRELITRRATTKSALRWRCVQLCVCGDSV